MVNAVGAIVTRRNDAQYTGFRSSEQCKIIRIVDAIVHVADGVVDDIHPVCHRIFYRCLQICHAAGCA